MTDPAGSVIDNPPNLLYYHQTQHDADNTLLTSLTVIQSYANQ